MAAAGDIIRHFSKVRSLSCIVRRDFTAGRIYFNKPHGPPSSTGQVKPKVKAAPKPTPAATGEVPGLSTAVLQQTAEPVGPGATKASKDYKNVEYFCYHNMSFHEAEVELAKYRLAQPSNTVPYKATSTV